MIVRSLRCNFRSHLSGASSLTGVLLVALATQLAVADDKATQYRMPPTAIASLIDAPRTPSVSVSPDREWMILMARPSLPPISEVAQPEMRVAGLRINPRTNGRSRTSYYTGLTLKRIDGKSEKRIKGFPTDPRIGSVRWSPDSKTIACTITKEDGIELWSIDVAKASARPITDRKINAAYGSAFSWTSDNESLIARFLPKNRGKAPAAPIVPTGPTFQESTGRKAPARTYQDLLKNAHDKAIFDHFMTSRAFRVTLDGHMTPVSETGVITSAEPSPDGKFVLVQTLHRPYSYLVPLRRFPKRVEIRDMNGNQVRLVADLPLHEEVPIGFGAVATGPRSFGWRSDVPATLYWAEAQDGGDPKKDVDIRDRVYTLNVPFTKEKRELVALGLRFGGMTWGSDQMALASEWWWKSRKSRTWIVNPSAPGSQPTLLHDRSFEDRYNDPGRPMMTPTALGTRVILTENGGKTLFYTGRGASPDGDRPFIDELDINTKETKRVWRSQAPFYESAITFVDANKRLVLTRRESIDETPNYFVRDLNLKGDPIAVTEFPHPTPQLRGVYKEQIRYARADGVMLTATLYLPPGKKPEDGPFPMLMWAYPQEFKSADAAGQVTDSPYRFVRTHSHSPLLWLVHGYAVLDDPTLPIVGEGEAEPNDTYIAQLVAGAGAAVDVVVRRGVADRGRIAIGGHSYGAFMAANLLAHSDLFAAGIARSGAYNRTLTPFGFQAEERTFWEAPDVYFTMSPFMHADKVNEPILLIHGEADNNSGTFPIQSKRYYHALKGQGAVARLVMFPHEAHGYRSRESVMHMATEMTDWLDTYVKNAKK